MLLKMGKGSGLVRSRNDRLTGSRLNFNLIYLQTLYHDYNFISYNPSRMKKFFTRLSCVVFFGLLVSCQSLLAQSTVKWERCLGGSKEDKARSIIPAGDGGYIIVGSSKSNDFDVTGHHGSTDSTDGWALKVNAVGGIEWQRSVGGSGSDIFNAVTATSDNGFLCLGTTSSNDGDVMGNHGRKDLWLVKLTANGGIAWSKCLGGSLDESGTSIRLTIDGGFIVVGSAASTDGNLSVNYGYDDAWAIKLDASGNIQWQRVIGNVLRDFANDVIEAKDSSYIVVGSAGPITPAQSRVTYGIVAKLSKDTGAIVWGGSFNTGIVPGGSFPTTLPSLNAQLGDNFYNVRQWWNGDIILYVGDLLNSFDPDLKFAFIDLNTGKPKSGGTYADVHSFGNYMKVPNPVTVLPDSSLAFCYWGVGRGASYTTVRSNLKPPHYFSPISAIKHTDENVTGIIPLENRSFFFCGESKGSGPHNRGDFDVWIVRVDPLFNTVKGQLFYDRNSNAVKDSGEEPYREGVRVTGKKSATVNTSFTSSDGSYELHVDTGTTTITPLVNNPYYIISPVSSQVNYTSYGNTANRDFALQPIPGKRDLRVTVGLTSPAARAGFATAYTIVYSNVGTDTVANGAVKMIKPAKLIFTGASVAPDNISGDTLSWNYTNLRPGMKANIDVKFSIPPIPVVKLGDTLIADFSVLPIAGDLTPVNNHGVVRTFVVGSYDPNDKAENNAGYITKQQADGKEALTYTIRFQNTGTDTAFRVIVTDTLDAKFDPATLQIVTASHAYNVTIIDSTRLAWTFDNIKLPDSTHNEPASHGYIVYTIQPRNPMMLADTVANSASIYFDYNPAVQTNKQLTIVKPELPSTPLVSGLLGSYCGTLGAQKAKVTNLPSVSSGVTVTVKIDATVLAVAADSTFSFTPSALAAGNHSVVITFTNASGTKNNTVNFNITQAVNPDVNVSANITNVINLADNVVITAANAAGGGTTPLYSFAKDKAFVNIMQVEGASNTLTIAPNNLLIGANWIYVRMKTSDACYAAQTNIDSIKIDRSSVTGLRDVDNPSQIINVYPNPFKQLININGLSTGKTYTITINNLNGQQVYSQQISNRSSFGINKTMLPGGSYWITIFDVKKKRIIGTVPLIKE
jgi:uncharacterized repeat protein (TIGR01451 family)